jgi:hypothetical protein
MVPGAAGLRDPRQRFTGATRSGGRKPVLLSAKIEPRECYHFEMSHLIKIPLWIKEQENSALSRDPPDYSKGGAPPRRGDGREDGAARGVHLSLAGSPRQEGSPMYQPSSLAYRRDRSAARDARVTYAPLPYKRFETRRRSEPPN